QEHGMEKIKTIGDAYMAAGGLPDANRTNPVDAVLAGLEIRDFMAAMRAAKRNAGQPYWELRLGIHSGPLMAGVIGHQKFAYDVWGDTVNTASRMESSGVAGEINVSSATYDYIKHFFACEYRGKIQAKNKGAIDMFLVQRILPDLSADAAGTQPNEQFRERYRKLGQVASVVGSNFFLLDLLLISSTLLICSPASEQKIIPASNPVALERVRSRTYAPVYSAAG
ncbi:MAG: adenylate/guanylate cyclase domain-containing protein, partial [Leptospiraceae bacterium]|nr:adenylate/guanylate cyclase domain-containing protein [Leptospiraceae bacterium]